MTENQDSPTSNRDGLQLLLSDLALISGTLSEIATVWRRALPDLPERPALMPEQLADAARQLASGILSLADADLLNCHAHAMWVVEQFSVLQQGVASAQAMTRGDGGPDLGDAGLWESLGDPLHRAARRITDLAPKLVTRTD
jgi:hypothetical protein